MRIDFQFVNNIGKNGLINRKNSFTLSFNALERVPQSDGFESVQSEIEILDTNKTKIKGRILKNISLKDKNNNKKDAFIVQYINDPDIYAVCLNEKTKKRKKPICKMYMDDNGSCMYISSIMRLAEYDNIKGAGTELVKFAAQKSIQKGYNGKVKLLAIASLPFYFKTNFRPEKSFLSPERDAYGSYIARNNTDLIILRPSVWFEPDFELTGDAANALLDDVRLYENKWSETTKDKILHYKDCSGKHSINIDVDFCEVTGSNPMLDSYPREYIIQLIQKDDRQIVPIASARLGLFEDDNGQNYMNINNVNINVSSPAPSEGNAGDVIMEELLNTAKKKAKEFDAILTGIDKINKVYDEDMYV